MPELLISKDQAMARLHASDAYVQKALDSIKIAIEKSCDLGVREAEWHANDLPHDPREWKPAHSAILDKILFAVRAKGFMARTINNEYEARGSGESMDRKSIKVTW